jgi:RNA polymerase sigma-70 factor (ECF subfamily)
LATISAHHCTSINVENTDWQAILDLYDNLILLDDSPIVLLNRAIVIYKISGSKEGLKAINEIQQVAVLESYLPFYTTKAELQFKDGDIKLAIKTLELALKLRLSEVNKELLISRLNDYLK